MDQMIALVDIEQLEVISGDAVDSQSDRRQVHDRIPFLPGFFLLRFRFQELRDIHVRDIVKRVAFLILACRIRIHLDGAGRSVSLPALIGEMDLFLLLQVFQHPGSQRFQRFPAEIPGNARQDAVPVGFFRRTEKAEQPFRGFRKIEIMIPVKNPENKTRDPVFLCFSAFHYA